ncbi:hypothetical protein M758_11G113700 [Ceratodon purpureus]|nr:hypothetical protein M758_11G113700 [Ceratodon purpureus]
MVVSFCLQPSGYILVYLLLTLSHVFPDSSHVTVFYRTRLTRVELQALPPESARPRHGSEVGTKARLSCWRGRS